ncbi:MAG: lysoplasmalogenase [Acidimicrobiales bacterium]
MTSAAFVLLTITLAVAVGDWAAAHAGNRALEYVCKPLTMVALIAMALAIDPHDPTVRTWFVVALAFSLVGDVFLMLPGDRFVPGLAAFLLAHVAYAIGMLVDGVGAGRVVMGLVVVGAALAVMGSALVRGLRATEPTLAGPVVAYMTVISAMVVCAVGTGRGLTIAGAVLFYASDSLIGWGRFVRAQPCWPLAVIVTYHLGQVLLTLSLV